MEWTTFWAAFSQTHPVTMILVGLGIDEVGIFNGHSEYFRTNCHVSSLFGIFCHHLVIFPPLWYVAPGKIWQPWRSLQKNEKKVF
jgi:hypothetical protein